MSYSWLSQIINNLSLLERGMQGDPNYTDAMSNSLFMAQGLESDFTNFRIFTGNGERINNTKAVLEYMLGDIAQQATKLQPGSTAQSIAIETIRDINRAITTINVSNSAEGIIRNGTKRDSLIFSPRAPLSINFPGLVSLPVGILPEANTPTSMGHYNNAIDYIGLSPAMLASPKDPLDTVMHELGHRFDRNFRALNTDLPLSRVNSMSIPDLIKGGANPNYLQYVAPYLPNAITRSKVRLSNEFKLAGYNPYNLPEEMVNFSTYYNSPAEVFARDFASWSISGGEPDTPYKLGNTFNSLYAAGFITRDDLAVIGDLIPSITRDVKVGQENQEVLGSRLGITSSLYDVKSVGTTGPITIGNSVKSPVGNMRTRADIIEEIIRKRVDAWTSAGRKGNVTDQGIKDLVARIDSEVKLKARESIGKSVKIGVQSLVNDANEVLRREGMREIKATIEAQAKRTASTTSTQPVTPATTQTQTLTAQQQKNLEAVQKLRQAMGISQPIISQPATPPVVTPTPTTTPTVTSANVAAALFGTAQPVTTQTTTTTQTSVGGGATPPTPPTIVPPPPPPTPPAGGGGGGNKNLGGSGASNNGPQYQDIEPLRRMYPEAFQRAESQMGKLTSGPGTTVKALDDLTKGISTLSFKVRDASGRLKELNLVIDHTGKTSGNIAQVYTKQGYSEAVRNERINRVAVARQALKDQLTQDQYNALPPTVVARMQDLDLETGSQFLTSNRRQLRSFREDTTGNTRYQFRYKDDQGMIHNNAMTVDKYGRILQDTSKRFSTFTQSISRNMREFFQWSLAVGIVYTPLQKLNELVQISIANEAKLADITVTLGQTQEATSLIFSNAAKIAKETGESVDGVLEGYNLAFRATGNIQDQTERYTVANKLLSDSIILAKLSSLDQAGATDTLTAALRQSGMGLEDGQTLLDKWIKVSKSANVDLSTLATSFAIVGEAAFNAGLGVDELNGLIATVAEVGVTSAKETGNAVRALISGYSTDGAVKELTTYGIAVTDAEGKTRGFKEVFQDLRDASKTGLINEDQLNKIAYAIGGGNRRQAQVVSAIVNLDRMDQVAAQSAIAHAEAQKALGIELDTVQTKSTLLSNSFQNLAQVLGTQGGVLDGTSAMLTLVTGLTDALTGLTGALGTAAPVLATLGAVSFITRGTTAPTDFLGNIARGGAKTFLRSSNIARKLTGASVLTKEGIAAESKAFSDSVKANAGSIGGIIAIGFMAGLEATKGNWGSAGITMGAGVLAGIVSGWNPVAMIISSTIAESVVNSIQQTAARIGTEPLVYPQTESNQTPISADESTMHKLAALAGGGNATLGSIRVWANQANSGLYNAISSIFTGESLPKLNPTQVAATYAVQNGVDPSVIRNILMGEQSTFGTNLGITTAYTNDRINPARDDEMASMIRIEMEKYLREKLYNPVSGISTRQFTNKMDLASKFESSLPRLLAPLNGDYSGLGVNSETGAARLYADILVKGNDEQLTSVLELSASIEDLYEKIETAKRNGDDRILELDSEGNAVRTDSIDIAQERLDKLADSYRRVSKTVLDQIRLSSTEVPEFVSVDDFTLAEFEDVILPEIERQKQERLAAMTPDEAEKQMVVWAYTSMIIDAVDGMKRVTGVPQDLMSESISNLEKEGKLSTSTDTLRTLSIDSSQIPEVLARYDVLKQKAEAAGMKVNEKDGYYIATKDAYFDFWKKDMTLIQMAIQDLIDVNQKQLDGMYNLPDGASIFVPIEAAKMYPRGGGGGSGVGTTEENGEGGEEKTPHSKETRWDENYTGTRLTDAVLNALGFKPPDYGPFASSGSTISLGGVGDTITPPQTENPLLSGMIDTLMPGQGNTDLYSFFIQLLGQFGLQQFFGKAVPNLMQGWGLGDTTAPSDSPVSQFKGWTPLTYGPGISAVPQTQFTPVTQKVNVDLNTTTNLVVDGRRLATVVKAYLVQDLLRSRGSGGSAFSLNTMS